MKDHIKEGIKIIFSFKTEKYYLVHNETVITEYDALEDGINKAENHLDYYIRGLAWGAMPKELYEQIRRENKEE